MDGDFGPANYPAVPGHEVAGVVTWVGPEVNDVEVRVVFTGFTKGV